MSSHEERNGARHWTEANAPHLRFGRGGKSGSAVHDMIGRRIKANYDTQPQPLPDRLRELLEELNRLSDSATPEH